MTNLQLTSTQFNSLKECIVERIVDNMGTKELVRYVTEDLTDYYDTLTLSDVIEDAECYYDEEGLEELIELVKEED
mgnify:CR=1 FL=1